APGLRTGGAAGSRSRGGLARAVPRLVRRRPGRAGDRRAERDGPLHRDPGGAPERAHRPAQGRRRARVRALHEPRFAQGPRGRGQPGRRAAVPVARDRAPGRRRRAGGARGGRRGGRVLRLAPARVARGRARERAVGRARLAGGARRARGAGRGPLPGGRGRPAAGRVGRAADRAAGGRVLAGAPEPAPRPPPLPPGGRRWLARRAVIPL
ncbi:MAG: Pyridoxamine 5'-phosphate oxidase, partial [uncultured Solirubrobacteraceae bacterium]